MIKVNFYNFTEMKNLKTKFMGIEIDNPIVVGASNLVTKTDNLKKAEDQGAAAIVYKSLFILNLIMQDPMNIC